MAKKKSRSKKSLNNNIIFAVLISILITLPLGYALGSSSSQNNDQIESSEEDHDHSTDTEHSDMKHSHPKYEIPENVNPPEIVTMNVTKDAKSGWNLSFTTNNFEMSPENVNGPHVENQGHAHLYIDGNKITRLYSTDYYIGELEEGQHEILITLNTNDHKDYAIGNSAISAKKTIVDSHHSNNSGSSDHEH